MKTQNTKFPNDSNCLFEDCTPGCGNCNLSRPDSHFLANHVELSKLDVKQNDNPLAKDPIINIKEINEPAGEPKGRRRKNIPKKRNDDRVSLCQYCDCKTSTSFTFEEHMDEEH